MNHVGRSFKVAVVDSNPPQLTGQSILPLDWSAIDTPVPGLPIILGFKCNLCGWLVRTQDSIKQHYIKKHRPTNPIASITTKSAHTPSRYPNSRAYIQKLFPPSSPSPPLFPHNSGRCNFQVMHIPESILQVQPSTLKTQSSSHSAHPFPTTVLPPYISALGWVEWLQNTQLSPHFLKWLATPPRGQQIKTDNSALNKVEHGLYETSELLKEYLNAADELLSSMTPSIRDAIRGK
jgi:hypothetical protein